MLVCTPTEINLVVGYQKCMPFNIFLTFEIYGRYVVEQFIAETKMAAFL